MTERADASSSLYRFYSWMAPFHLRVDLVAHEKLPIAVVGSCSTIVAAADILGLEFPPNSIAILAVLVAIPAAAIFLRGACDMRFQRAVSAMGSELRAQTHKGRKSSFFRMDDPLLRIVQISLIIVFLMAGMSRDGPAAGLCFSAFCLAFMAQLGLAVRDYSTDRFSPFS